MSCTGNKACCAGECARHCKGNCGSMYEAGFDSIVELEIHYSWKEEEAYVLESIYCITNIQTKSSRVTGLEGKKFNSLDEMGQQIIDCLSKSGDPSWESLLSADIIYVSDEL